VTGSPDVSAAAPRAVLPPPPGTRERWAWDLVRTTDLERKLGLAPGSAPSPELAWETAPPPRRLAAPGRPPELRVIARSPRTPRPGALAAPDVRARLVHTFLHHELQAAELMAWALLAFPRAPRRFRHGLVGIAAEELAHARLYARHLRELGHAVGAFPVRDWFWERVPRARSARQFAALLGIGFEGGNLEHCRTFAARFRAAGDARGAELIERVGREEVAHVRFALRWVARWSPGFDFDQWLAALVPPLTPTVLRGRPLDRDARRRAGFDEAFLDWLEAWEPARSGS